MFVWDKKFLNLEKDFVWLLGMSIFPVSLIFLETSGGRGAAPLTFYFLCILGLADFGPLSIILSWFINALFFVKVISWLPKSWRLAGMCVLYLLMVYFNYGSADIDM